jgi:hypothetical protein
MTIDSLVVLESEARWPTWLGEAAEAAGHTAVVAQRKTETLAAFKRRATRRMRSLQGRATPQTGLLVCNCEAGAGQFESRRSLLQALLSMMQRADRGHVVLVADGDYALRRRLAWLASELNTSLAPDSFVAVRFRALPRAEAPAIETVAQTRLRVA